MMFLQQKQMAERGWLLAFIFLHTVQIGFAQNENWNVNSNEYEYSMSVTAVLENMIPSFSTNSLDRIAAFDTLGNCVGSAYTSTYFSPLDANLAFMMVYSNNSSGPIDIKAYIESIDEIVEVGTLDFSINANVGSLSSPLIFSVNSTVITNGCTDNTAFNYNSSASLDDGSCEDIVYGCTDSEAFNYDVLSNESDNSCVDKLFGCLDMNYSEYNDLANTSDNSCSITWEQAYSVMSQQDDSSAYILIIANLELNVQNLEISVLAYTDTVSTLTSTNESLNSNLETLEIANAIYSDSVVVLNTSLTAQNLTLENLEFELSIAQENEETHELTDRLLDFRVGWSMFGYTCIESVDAMEGFTSISEDIAIVKDEMGATYLPEYGFNDIGNLNFGKGYQIKMIEAITTFQFCSTLIAP